MVQQKVKSNKRNLNFFRTYSIANIVETSVVNSQKSINKLGTNTPPTSLSDIRSTNTNKTVIAKGDSGAFDITTGEKKMLMS